MNNEIGRKITSLTLMTIMVAGGLTFAVPGVMPAAHAANANLFVSAENSQFDNYMSGPQVIEVVVIDSDINETDELNGEPDVEVNGQDLRMIQAVDGNWYGYFSDLTQATVADATTTTAGTGLDFGFLCTVPADITTAAGFIGVNLSDSDGVALGATDCAGAGADPLLQNVLREEKDINEASPDLVSGTNPPGVTPTAWPFIQLYDLSVGGNVIVQYNKGGGVQTTTLTFDTVEGYASSALDRSVYSPGMNIHTTITDLWLNIDPTDEDSWTFATQVAGPANSLGPYYQIFDENGALAGDDDGVAFADYVLSATERSSLMCEDNCILLLDINTQGAPDVVIGIQDNDDSEVFDPADPLSTDATLFESVTLPAGSGPLTFTEQGPNSGVFSATDEADASNIIISSDADRGTSATIDYNESPVSVLVGFITGSVDIQPVDDEWSSGEEIPVVVNDHDLNTNSRADEDLDLNSPDTDHIPTLQTGSPITLEEITDADFTLLADVFPPINYNVDNNGDNETVEQFSQRAFLQANGGDLDIADTDTLTLNTGVTFDEFYDSINEDGENDFRGVSLINYDIRSIFDNAPEVGSVDVFLSDGTDTVLIAADQEDQALINLKPTGVAPPTPSVFDLSVDEDVLVVFEFNVVAGPSTVIEGTVMPVVVDFFSFGFFDDGESASDRVANQIIRLELEETGDNTGLFEGSLEYTMINQLNVLDEDTYEGLSTIADDPTFIVFEDLTDEDSPRVNYLEIISDGLPTIRSDQEEAPSHSGIVSFDNDNYKVADTVKITLEDQDLNVDSDLLEIYTTVSAADAADPAFGTVGEPDLPELSFGPLGRLLDVTFDDVTWKTPQGTCELNVFNDDTGLDALTFSLVETGSETGVFEGEFEIPDRWCRADDGDPETTTGLDLEVNYVDFRDASGEIIEVGDSAGIRANTGSISLDRTVYPVPFGMPSNFPVTSETSPNSRSLFPIHQTGMDTAGTDRSDSGLQSGEFLPAGDLNVHLRVNDPDFDTSGAGENFIAQDRADLAVGPVKISVIRGSDTVILGFAGGAESNDGLINVGNTLTGDGSVENGEITVTSSTDGFDGIVTSGSASDFITTPGAVTITQGTNTVDATFTNSGVVGLDSGSELGTFLDGTGDLSAFTNGAVIITDVTSSSAVGAIFTDSGATGLGAGSEIDDISSFATGSVLICQTGISSNDCATGIFANIGNGEVSESELEIETSVDIGGTPDILELDDRGVSATITATATWDDTNNDDNVDDGELTIVNDGEGYTDGSTLDITDPDTTDIIATATFNDASGTLETSELTISPSPSGIGFVNGAVTITPNPSVSGVSATGSFVDNPSVREFGPIEEIAPTAGIFELDLTIKYTDGPSDTLCPETTDFEPLDGSSSAGTNAESSRFNTASGSNENYCILQGDILQVEYEDPTDASGDLNTVTDSATFDLRNGVLQSDKSVYIIGSDIILTLIEPDLDLDNDGAETWDLDLIEWDSDAATITMGDADGEGAAFDPEPSNFRETGDSTGIFQIVIETPEVLEGDRLERGEEIILEYTDWGPSGSDYVGDEDEDVNLTLYTSNFGATVELDQKVYSWTDKAFVTIVAPDHNFDSDLVDEVGNSDLDPIKVSTRGFDLDNYKLVETGTDTGIFTGEVILTGFTHDADGDGTDDTNPRTQGQGPTDGFIQSDDDDGLTVSFEFSEDETVVGSALIRWNIGEVQWLEASYPASGTGVVRIIDPDMNLDPEAVDNFDVDTWSDSDAGGIDLTVTETNEATGIFEGTVFFTVTDESSGHRLRVAEGDTVTAEYEDNTLPDPYTTADELDITATSLIGTVVPPLERAPIASCRVVDAFGNTLSSVSVDQQVQITCDLANGQDREQQFAYLVQVQDGNGVTVSLAWITGSLAAGQTFSPALSWIPEAVGSYDATTFVWESVDNPTALSPPVDTPITVN